MGRKRENPVYAYFDIDSDHGIGRCLLGGCSYHVKSPICGNLEKHLKRHHPYHYDNLMKHKEKLASFMEKRFNHEGTLEFIPFHSALPPPPPLPPVVSYAKHDLEAHAHSHSHQHHQFNFTNAGETIYSIKTEDDEEHFETASTVALMDTASNRARSSSSSSNTSTVPSTFPINNVADTTGVSHENIHQQKDNEPNSITSTIPEDKETTSSPITSTLHHSPSRFHPPNEDNSIFPVTAVTEAETDAAFCSYILKELTNVRNPHTKRMLKIKIVSEILNAQQ